MVLTYRAITTRIKDFLLLNKLQMLNITEGRVPPIWHKYTDASVTSGEDQSTQSSASFMA